MRDCQQNRQSKKKKGKKKGGAHSRLNFSGLPEDFAQSKKEKKKGR
jgi:hypothetical protein